MGFRCRATTNPEALCRLRATLGSTHRTSQRSAPACPEHGPAPDPLRLRPGLGPNEVECSECPPMPNIEQKDFLENVVLGYGPRGPRCGMPARPPRTLCSRVAAAGRPQRAGWFVFRSWPRKRSAIKPRSPPFHPKIGAEGCNKCPRGWWLCARE